MTRMTGGRALVEMLGRHGIDTLFALPGVQNDALFVALYDAGEAIRVIHPRHEQAAAYMAYGYARASGKVGAFAVVPGPGLLNTTAALATAWATNAPVLCISGQIPSNLIGRGFGLLHEIPDQLAILQGLTKWAARINHPTETGRLVNQAFRQLAEGRPRPVALEMPLDIMALDGEVSLPGIEAPSPPSPPDADLIDKAAALLGNAKQPLIYVGSGAAAAGAEVLAVAERLQAPVTTYTGGKGIVSDRHYLSQNLLAGNELWRSADVVLAIGTRLNQPLTRWGTDSDIKIIRVDLDPVEINRIARPAIGIVADAKEALTALLQALPAAERSSRRDELDGLKAKTAARLRETLGPQCEYLDTIRAELPDDGIYVEDLTQVGYVGRLAFPVYHPRTYIHSGYQGTLGFSYATALGAKVARPDTPVVSISGDGGFMYNVQELSTAALHGIDVVAIVFADGAYGNVRRMQKQDYGNRLIATDLLNPNFPKMADSYGIAGVRTTTPDGLRRELAAALKRRGPSLIEVAVGEMPDPWPTLIMNRVRGR
ncbi:MAG TPA: thiamine pyrophosphate-dependent enzyme [Stellaceae bacterium]|jgi:acetolactate synthase-1/2/3 large subunit|nr:thiamine pyrophosphate-dependent enzyme [Stellaceae bacterium]